jgi:hypothetical protein
MLDPDPSALNQCGSETLYMGEVRRKISKIWVPVCKGTRTEPVSDWKIFRIRFLKKMPGSESGSAKLILTTGFLIKRDRENKPHTTGTYCMIQSVKYRYLASRRRQNNIFSLSVSSKEIFSSEKASLGKIR